ncbi:hypothetical protein [Modestobacter sp. Leaf380]|uniref:hypothetical protein n=1 Tax=Modestobacter sp. Leaf380 TaxID=1736356 RepID=UPI0012F8ABEB|nr:hypothetical protein [Modestobacter sp. Leaf380]
MRLLTLAPMAAATLLVLAGCATASSTSDAATPATSTSTAASTSAAAPISPRISVPAAPVATDPRVDGYPVGQAVPFDGGFTVTVDAVDLDAAAEVAALVPGVASANGRLVLVTLSVSVTEGVEASSLPVVAGSFVVDLVGPQRETLPGVSGCDGTSELREPAVAVPAPGQPVTWQECLDASPADAVGTSKVKVTYQPTITSGEASYWSLG